MTGMLGNHPRRHWQRLAYEKRAEANRRWHCACGRFAKPGQKPQLNILGEYEFSVHCKVHGEVWIS